MPVSVVGGKLRIQVAYHPNVIARIKLIPGRRWDAAERVWTVPLEFLPDLRETLPHLAYDGSCDHEYARLERTVQASSAMDTDLISPDMPGGTLRPYQAAGVRYLEGKHGRAMIADEMGLGKTIQTLAYIHRHPELKVLVVCPATVKEQWRRETLKWLDCPEDNVAVLAGRNGHTPPESYRILIVNYDIIGSWTFAIAAWKPDLLVLDESVYVKERKSQRSLVAAQIASQCKYVIALSGRPVLNRPAELWNQLAIVRPDLPLGSWSAFAKRYANYHQTRYGWEMGKAEHLEELEKRLRANVMIQRRKADVLTELPELDRVTVPLEVDYTGEASYEGLELADITKMRREAGLVKLLPAIQWLQEARENISKLVVFAHHHDVLDAIAAAFDVDPIDGRTSAAVRQAHIDAFQEGDSSLLICGTRAMGMGINLQAGSTAVFVELDWNMAAHEQAESRLHRMGQKNAVTAYYLIAEGTIDEPMMELLAEKQEVSEKVVGEDPTPRVIERLRELMEAKS